MELLQEFIRDKNNNLIGPKCLGWVPTAYDEFVKLINEGKLPGITIEDFNRLHKELTQDEIE
jgi:hypothetical protein